MKKNRLLLFVFSYFLYVASSNAQDLHFTMYNMSPLTLNPANTGAFLGTARIGGIYRSQWNSAINGYQTPSLYVDAPILAIGKKKRDWLGVGATLVNDVAGTSKLTTSFFMFSGSLHKVLGKKGDNVLTFGVQGGTVSRRLQTSTLIFEDQLSLSAGGGVDRSEDIGLFVQEQQNERTGENQGIVNHPDISLGFLFTSTINKDTRLRVGFATNHLINLGNDYGLFRVNNPDDKNRRPLTLKFHTDLSYQLDEKWSVHPTAFFQTTTGLSEVIVQANAGYQIKENLQLLLGPSIRVGDALSLIGGARIKDLQVMASYDFTTSQLANDGRIRDGFELSANYIIKIYKEPKVTPKILCPQF